MPTRRSLIPLTVAAALLPAAVRAREKLKIVASFSILADFARQVGGERVDVRALVGPDGDAHVYAPVPADAQRLAEAKLILVNGLGFEGWMERLVKSSAARAALLVASRGVKPPQGDSDPHAFQDIGNARLYVANIREALIAADPAGRAAYEANAAAYLAKLEALETEVKAAVAKIPPDRRKIISSHDAFGYFERAYGVRFIAATGVSTEAEASAKDVANIIRRIRAEKIPAVFLENVQDRRLLDQIARETGARIGGTLYSDALSPPEGPAAAYLDMMRHNLRQLVAALAPDGA